MPALVVDGNRARRRLAQPLQSLCLHDPVFHDHFPYLPFPDHWPLYTPKDKWPTGSRLYAAIMEIDFWAVDAVPARML